MAVRQGRSYWLDYLRGFITVLVVAHHSSLAYTTFAYADPRAYNASTHPIVDTARSITLDIFEDFNDVFFMSLMFLISGIFVVPSLVRKGHEKFLSDRARRLFIPFLVAVTLIMPLGYFAAWQFTHHSSDLKAFLVDFIKVEHWPAGPPWFIGILFIFNIIVCLSWRPPAQTPELFQAPMVKPFSAGGLLWRAYILTLFLFLPMVLLFGGSAWIGFGPFAIQLSRIFLYFGYFLIGMKLGTDTAGRGPGKSLLDETSPLMRHTILWLILCVAAYTTLKLAGPPIGSLNEKGQITELQARLLYRPIWTLSCVASCMAFLSLFHRLFPEASRPSPPWESLSRNAYGIYLVHYVFVLWIQYLLLPTPLGAIRKFSLTFIGALTASWALTAISRKIPIFKR